MSSKVPSRAGGGFVGGRVGWMVLIGLLGVVLDAGAARFALTDEYVIDNWQTEDGLPENSATAMVQTPDGYLWISTFNGLVRFDGIHFRVFDASNTPELPARRVANLHLSRAGDLWISFENGLTIYRDGRFTRLPAASGYQGDFVRSFAEAPDGSLFVTTFDGGVYVVRDRQFTPLPYPVAGVRTGLIGATDGNGTCYLLKAGGEGPPFFGIWSGGAWQSLDPGEPLVFEGCMLGRSASGEIWLLNGSKLQQWAAGGKMRERMIRGDPKGIWALHPDSDGRIWLPSYDSGLYRVEHDGALTHFTATNGLAYNSVRFVFEDRQRNRWIGTSGGGLTRFFERRVRMYGPAQGLTEPVIKSVAAMPDGRLAVGSWKRGVFVLDPGAGQVRPLEIEQATYIQGVLPDARGRLWVASFGEGTWVVDTNGVRQAWFDGEAGREMISLFRDRSDRIWATGIRGVTRIDGDVRTTFANPAAVGATGFIAMTETADGRILAGTLTGLHEFRDGAFEPFRVNAGPAPTEVMALLADEEGRIWVGSSLHGLFLVRDGRSFQFGEPQGLVTRSVTGLARDDQNRLWLGTHRGVMGASIDELEAVASGRLGRATVITLGTEDGMATQECATSHQPTIARTADGTLWFATGKGVARVVPADIQLNPARPLALLDEARYLPAPERSQDHDPSNATVELRSIPLSARGGSIELPPGSRFLEIAYNTAEFTHPQRVRFETRIEGAGDDRWRFVNDRRTAYFPDLEPGHYRFQVRAYNQDGLVSETPATLAFSIAPFYWQTWWFRGGTTAALVALGGGGLRWLSRRRGRHRDAVQRAHEAARERYVRVIENTSDLVGFASPDRKIIYANRAARRALGFSPTESIEHLTPRDIYPAWAYQRVTEEGLPTAIREGFWQGNSALLTRDGREVPVWQVLVAHHKPDGSLDFISSIGKDMSEIARAGDALRMSEDKFAKVFHCSPDAIVISRVDNDELLDVNEGFEQMFGRHRREVLGRSATALGIWARPEEQGRFARLFHDVGRIRNFEAGLVMADGRRGTGLVSADGVELTGAQCQVLIVRDITERKVAEAAVEASRNMLRQVLDSIPVRVFWKDRQSVFLGGNRLWAGDGGYQQLDDLIGKTDFDFSTAAEAEAYRADDQFVMGSGVPKLRYEEVREARTGGAQWLLTSKIPMRGPQGEVVGILGLYEDITERKQMELALRDREMQLALALHAAEMGVWEWRVGTNQVIWSERVAEIFGLRLQDFRGDLEDYQARIHPDDAAMVGARIKESLRDGVTDYSVEHRIILPTGSIRWIEARGRVFRDAEGRPERLGGLMWDVTARKNSESNLLRIAQGIGGLSGRALMESILATLSQVTQADYAFLGRLLDGHFIETEAVYADGRLTENLRYDLVDTPCAKVMERAVCVYPAGVQQLFPKDQLLRDMGVEAYAGVPLNDSSGRPSGLLVALFRRPLARAEEVQSVVSILAAAASADAERSKAVGALKQANADLEERVRARTDELQRLVNLMAGREVRMAELKAEIRTLKGETAASEFADSP